MPYIYSRARKQFLAEVASLIESSREADSTMCASLRVRALAQGSTVMLTSAKVEAYLEDLIFDWGQAISTAGVLSGSLPNETRAFLLNGSSVKTAYRKLLLQEQGERGFVELVASHVGPLGEYRFARDNSPVSTSSIRLIVKDVRYPSEENLNKIFFRCGIKALFPKLNSLAKRDVLSLLRSFSDVRTALAHEGLPVGINGKDVRDRILGVTQLVGYLDRLFYRHTAQLFGASSWTT